MSPDDPVEVSPVMAVPRLYESTVERVLGVIAERGLIPGQALPTERELAEQLRVSRNVLRQAFGVLEDRGLISSRRGAGRYLREADRERGDGETAQMLELASIADILEARVILEAHVAALACQRRTVEEATALVALAERLQSWEDNVAFHTAIASMTHNFVLQRNCRQQVELQGQLHMRSYYREPDELDQMRAEHRDIAMAILARDEARARELVQSHLQRTGTAVRDLLRTTPESN